jgi:hypothetical protein
MQRVIEEIVGGGVLTFRRRGWRIGGDFIGIFMNLCSGFFSGTLAALRVESILL